MRISTPAGVSLAFLAALLLGCSGGGGGGAPPDDNPPPMADLLNYSISPPSGGAESLSASWLENSVQFGAVQLTGTYRRSNAATTMSAGSMMSLDSGELLGVLDIQVTARVDWSGTRNPDAGAMQVDWEGGYVIVTVNPDAGGAGTAGVDLAFYEDGTLATPVVGMAWDAFEDVEVGDPVPEYQQVASFAYGAWQFYFRHVLIAFDALKGVTEESATIEAAGGAPVAFEGEEFPPGSGSAGQVSVLWSDLNPDGSLGAGDDVTAQYTNWWVDDPESDYDDLYQGILRLVGMIDDPNEKRLGASVLFESYEERETDAAYQVDEEELTIVQGGFDLLLDW